ncbi:hypothetical protein EU523_01250, partial [Candidatus Heimdallarchaeota archaeon]
NKEAVSLPEVVTIFKHRKSGDQELNYLQRITEDHAKNAAKLTKREAQNATKTLMSEFDLSERIALTIVNFMPTTINELRVFLQDAKKVYSTDELHSMLEVLRE